MGQGSIWASAALLGAGVLLVRELSAPVQAIAEIPGKAKDAIAASGAAAGQSAPGQAVLDIIRRVNVGIDQAGRTVTAAQITQRHATGERGTRSNWGSISGRQGTFTGLWENHWTRQGGACRVVHATRHGSNTWRIFQGEYCRKARAAGLIA